MLCGHRFSEHLAQNLCWYDVREHDLGEISAVQEAVADVSLTVRKLKKAARSLVILPEHWLMECVHIGCFP